MDQFLPGDIAVMVLKYLASTGCESTVVTMIEEMPVLQHYVPRQLSGVSRTDFVRMVGRPSLTPCLNDILNDYGHSKMFVTDFVERQTIKSGSPLRLCDSLLTHLKILSNILNDLKKDTGTSASKETKPTGVEIAINTDDVILEPQIKSSTSTKDADTQTIELPVMEIGSEGELLDVPLMFYNSLMSDSNLQQKLAMAINQHLTDSSSSKNEVLQKVCSTAETDIDKFLVDLLKDVPAGSDIEAFSSLSSLDKSDESQNPIFNEVERNLANLFQDAHSVIAEQPVISAIEPSCSVIHANKIDVLQPDSISHNEILSTTSTFVSVKANNMNNKLDNPVQTKRIPKKRIAPTPAPKTVVNPVFEKQVERAVSLEGRSYSVHKDVPVISDWQKLGRRSITPKIPVSTNHEIPTPSKEIADINLRVHKRPLISENKRKAKSATPMKLTPEKARSSDINFFLVYHDTPKVGQSSVGTLNIELEPEVLDSSSGEATSQKETQQITQPELKNYQTPVDKPDKISNILKASSTVEVTPTLDMDIPCMNFQSSIPQSVSPRIHRLIASAQKVRATSTQVNLVRRSYSTPRKKKHVRNLLFTTPPSLKNGGFTETPNSPSSRKITNGQGVSLALPLKRKFTAEEDCVPKSKKRLQWLEEDSYESSAFPDRNFPSTRVSASMLMSANKVLQTKNITGVNEKALTETTSGVENRIIEPSNVSNSILTKKSKPVASKHIPLPKILEETPTITPNCSATRSPSPLLKLDDVIICPEPPIEMPFSRSTSKDDNCVLLPVPPEIDNSISSLQPKQATLSPVKPACNILSITLSSSDESVTEESFQAVLETSVTHTKGSKKSYTLMNELFGSEDSVDDDDVLFQSKKRQKNQSKNKNTVIATPDTLDTVTNKKLRTKNSQNRNLQLQKPTAVYSTSDLNAPTVRLPENSEKPLLKTKSTEQDAASKKSPKNSSIVSPKRKPGRKSKRVLEAEAAKSVSTDAVALGHNSNITNKSTTTKSPIKNSSCVRINQNELSTPIVISKIETPLKTPIISFNILPPLGFPDPTPTKTTTVEPISKGYSCSPLVTPMKSGASSTSPPVALPPTPRYLINDADADSNSISIPGMFRMLDGMYPTSFIDSTPSKFLGPPPTPGRSLFREELSETNFPVVSIQYAQPNSNCQNSDRPLDLSSPVAPHRIPRPPVVSHEASCGFKVRSSPEKTESAGAILAKKLAAWKAKKVESKPSEFQVPKGAPKKASPSGLNVPKIVSLIKVGKSTDTRPSLNIVVKSPTVPMAITEKTEIRTGHKFDTVTSACPDMRFVVDGRAKKLSMSEHQSILGLLEMGTSRRTNYKRSTELDITANSCKQKPLQVRGLLTNIDLNNFLNNVVHKISENKPSEGMDKS